MVKNGVITLTEEEQRSVFGNNKPQNNNMGLQVEKTVKKQTHKKQYIFNQAEKLFIQKPQTKNL